jgi:membrane protease YdiL (CAAX protease family)
MSEVKQASALALFWMAGSAVALGYASWRGIPIDLAARLLPAFLLEATFFLLLGVESARAKLERLHPATTAILLTLSAALPYTLATLALGAFEWQAFGIICGLTAIAAFWFALLPHRAPSDLLFLTLIGVVALSKILQNQYPDPHPRLPLGILGQLLWIRTAALALLTVRRVQGVGFGFWPEPRHWKIGALYFLAFLPAAAAGVWAVGFGTPHLPAAGWERIPVLALGTFFGILWVVALGEEFFFRGLLLQWCTQWFGNEGLALVFTSLLFGAVHLWYRQFPNWQLATLAAIAGVFYGLAFRHARSIRASMVTHALAVTTWRVFFS